MSLETQKYIFGYGSLMNPESLSKTISADREIRPAAIAGFKRKMNAAVEDYLYLNIIESKGSIVRGVLIPVTNEDIEALCLREPGYECVSVTKFLTEPIEGEAYAFIAPDSHYPSHTILRSYIITCVHGVPEDEREIWLAETIIENQIIEDLDDPQYEDAAV